MATTTALPVTRRDSIVRQISSPRWPMVAAATVSSLLLLGYHPYAEDGGIYSAAVALKLNPHLFPAERAFAVAHTARSLFVPLIAGLAAILHLPLEWALFLAYVVCLAATMVAADTLARLLFRTRGTQVWAVLGLAVSLGVPIAGTSLYLADPYLTARSISTPLLLWGIALLLRRKPAAAAACLAVSFAVHPLMSAWGAVLYAAILARRSPRPYLNTALVVCGSLAAMASLQRFMPPEAPAVRAAAITRGYWFVGQWQWYEVAGMIAPPVLMLLLGYGPTRRRLGPAARGLILACTWITIALALGSSLLIHTTNESFLLARMQPLRLLHTVYLIFVLILCGGVSTFRLRGRWSAAWLLCIAAAAGLFFMQRQIYPSSNHMELPGRLPANGYEQAFLWVRDHTPVNALFALDAHYTVAEGEDAHLFRAVALRSSLPDAAKDGGISSVMPSLAEEWLRGYQAQTGLNNAGDADRLARVRPLGATWIVLPATAATALPCPYSNPVAKVCQLY